mmetsp:Transcript_31374/g.51919  ORF Transcript_31374/g.51919 Transcript_31374/m.51919 type:complete len:493 (-) Transcript_31374:47-1525(-)
MRDFSVEVNVGGEALQQYSNTADGRPLGRTYIEMDLEHHTSYDVLYEDDTPHGREKNAWPVTPFTVCCRNTTAKQVWVKLWLDGEEVDTVFCSPQSDCSFKGFRQAGKICEFLFALPRYRRTTDKQAEVTDSSRFDQLGSVRCVFYEAHFLRREWRGGDIANHAGFRQANKDELAAFREARHVRETGEQDNLSGTTRQGRLIEESSSSGGWSDVYSFGSELESCVIHYRQKRELMRLKVFPSPDTVSADHFLACLLTKLRDDTGCDWNEPGLRLKATKLMASYQVVRLPQPAHVCKPSTKVDPSGFIKVRLGDSDIPRPRSGLWLKEVFGDGNQMCHATRDASNCFSAAAIALFGCEDMYLLLRLRTAQELMCHPERYAAVGLGQDVVLEDFSREPNPDLALQLIADVTGTHWLLHLGCMPHVFCPYGSTRQARGQPAYCLARTCEEHIAVLDESMHAAMKQRADAAVNVTYSDDVMHVSRKRSRRNVIELD